MKEQELLLKELALMLERQDMLSKLTEGKCLDEYGYSETHCIDYWKIRVTKCYQDRRTYGDDKRRDQQNDKEAVSERSD